MTENCQLPILLVDDNETFLQLQKKLLLCKGFSNVITVCDSLSVEEFLESRDVAVVVLDLMMPELNGQNLLKLITAKHPTIPVIILTSKNQLETAIDCMREGACDYLVKPLDYAGFLAAINRALDLRSLNDRVFTLRHSPLSKRVARENDFSYIVTRNTNMLQLLGIFAVLRTPRKPG